MKFKLSRLPVQLVVLVSLVCMISYTFAKALIQSEPLKQIENNFKETSMYPGNT